MIRDGDRTTKYYHTSTITRRRFNKIEALKNSKDEWCYDAAQVQGIVVDSFKKLFTDIIGGDSRTQALPGMVPSSTEDKQQKLSADFSSHGVSTALRSMGSLKAPGPDGFHALFFQRNWNLVGEVVCQTILKVLNGEALPDGMNDTFITLIPKVPSPETVTQFRPSDFVMSLINLWRNALLIGLSLCTLISYPLCNPALSRDAR